MKTKPPVIPARTVARPYVRPKPNARAWTFAPAPLVGLLPKTEPVAVVSAVEAAPAPAVVAAMVLIVEVFILTGS